MERCVIYAGFEQALVLPHDEERISINVPGLDSVLPILENYLNVLSEVRGHDGGLEVAAPPVGACGHASQIEDPRNLEVICKLYWSVRWNKRGPVDSIPLLAIDYRGRVRQHDGAAGLDHPVAI